MEDITVEGLKAKMDNKENFFLLDVREPHEYEAYNIGAKLIPLGNLPSSLAELENYKDTEIIVHCRSGARSASAKQFLMQAGFQNVKNLLGGMLDWKEKIDK
jgi:rhodanese-related sulfurtransferase